MTRSIRLPRWLRRAIADAVKEALVEVLTEKGTAPGFVEAIAVEFGQRGKGSKIKFDHEVRAFLIDSFGDRTIDETLRLAREKFGDRAPSRSAIGRFYKFLRDHRRAAHTNHAGNGHA